MSSMQSVSHARSWQRSQSPRSLRWLAVCSGLLLVLLVAALIFTPWQQNIPGTGRVIAYTPFERQQRIEAPIEGRISRWYVQEGSVVKKGDLLVELVDNDPLFVQRLEQEQQALQTRLDAAVQRMQAMEERKRALSASRAAAQTSAAARTRMAAARARAAGQAVRAAQANAKTARLNQERQQALLEKGLASSRTAELAELDIRRAETEQERAQAALDSAQDEEKALRFDEQRVGTDMQALLDDVQAGLAQAQADRSHAQAELARIDVRLSRQQAQFVYAPRDGTVLRLLANQGAEIVRPGSPLVLLVPDTHARAAEMWVDGNDVPLLSEGNRVRLQFEGWPAVQLVGWPSLAVGTFGGRVALIDATDDGKGLFRVVVVPDPAEPWPEARYLRQGVRVNAWILLNRVRLGYELWRQFNGFPPTLTPGVPLQPGPVK